MQIKNSKPINYNPPLHKKIINKITPYQDHNKLLQLPLEISARIIFYLPTNKLVEFSLLSTSCYQIGFKAYNYYIEEHYKELRFWNITLGNELNYRNYIYLLEQIHIHLTKPLFKFINIELFNEYAKLGLGAWIRNICTDDQGQLKIDQPNHQRKYISTTQKYFLNYHANDLWKLQPFVDLMVNFIFDNTFTSKHGLDLFELVLRKGYLKEHHFEPKHFEQWIQCMNNPTYFLNAVNCYITFIKKITPNNNIFIEKVFKTTKDCYLNNTTNQEFKSISIRCIGALLKTNLIKFAQIDNSFIEKLSKDAAHGENIPRHLALWILSVLDSKGKIQFNCLNHINIEDLLEQFTIDKVFIDKAIKDILYDLFSYLFQKDPQTLEDFFSHMQTKEEQGAIKPEKKTFELPNETPRFLKSAAILEHMLTKDYVFAKEKLNTIMPRAFNYIVQRGHYLNIAGTLMHRLLEKYPEFLKTATISNTEVKKLIRLLGNPNFEGAYMLHWAYGPSVLLSMNEKVTILSLLKKFANHKVFSLKTLTKKQVKTLSSYCFVDSASPLNNELAIAIAKDLVSKVETDTKCKATNSKLEIFYENLVHAISSQYKEIVSKALEAIEKSFFTTSQGWKYLNVNPINDNVKNLITCRAFSLAWHNKIAAMRALAMLIERQLVVPNDDPQINTMLETAKHIANDTTKGKNGYREDAKETARILLKKIN